MAVPAIAESGLVVAEPLEERSGKPTGGPASMTVTIYSGPATCVDSQTAPPTDGSAGVATTVSLAETQCVIVNFPANGVFTAKLTANPKSGTVACYAQLFKAQGCGLTLDNQYHGFPFDGAAVGNKIGCAKPPGFNYGAVQVVCV